jgi:hypothetical protein
MGISSWGIGLDESVVQAYPYYNLPGEKQAIHPCEGRDVRDGRDH